MNSSEYLKDWNLFFKILGSRVGPRTNKKIWMDLEFFIVLGSRYANQDPRTFTGFINLCSKIGTILSPFKLKKIANELLEKEEEYKILGFIVSTIQRNVRNKSQWNSIIKELKDKANIMHEYKLFSSAAFKKEPTLGQWGIISSKLELDDPEKYLNLEKLFKVPIIRNRFMGLKAVYSDLLSFKEYYGENESLNSISKRIYHDYNSVYQANENILTAS
jgi:hypothetical protein